MRIFNIMMSRKLGGIQQAFLDYSSALLAQGHEIVNITTVNSEINKFVQTSHQLPNLFPHCFISKIILKILILRLKPDLIIAHGNRAVSFSSFFKKSNIPLIGISHNYSSKYLKKCDYLIVLTQDLKQYYLSKGFGPEQMSLVPNMIKINDSYRKKEYQNPIIIGSFGRFVKNKGFCYLIEAIKTLKDQNYQIKLLLGGSGEEETTLKKLCTDLNLGQDIIFTGWVKDKKVFFESIDIFCLPSIIEPFGIILLEAMSYSVPIISTKTGGPKEILTNEKDALMVDIGSSADLADKTSKLILDPARAHNLSASAYIKLKEAYDMDIVGKNLSNILKKIVN